MSDSLSAEQRDTLAAVLDEIIPPSADGRHPGAGEIGVGSHVERGLAQMAGLVAMVQHGLALLDEIARRGGAASFAGVPRAQRRALLDELLVAQPHFLGPLLFHTYVGYYQHPRAIAALGLEPRPPHPKGHALETGDFSLLGAVRARGKIYRDA